MTSPSTASLMAPNTFCECCTSLLQAEWTEVYDGDYCWVARESSLDSQKSTSPQLQPHDDSAGTPAYPFDLLQHRWPEEFYARLPSHMPRFHLSLSQLRSNIGTYHLCSQMYHRFKHYTERSFDVGDEHALARIGIVPKVNMAGGLQLEFMCFQD